MMKFRLRKVEAFFLRLYSQQVVNSMSDSSGHILNQSVVLSYSTRRT